MEVQNAILTVYSTAVVMAEVEEMSNGVRLEDMDAALARASTLRRKFMSLIPLAPDVRPRTEAVSRMVKSAIDSVIQRSETAEGRRALAKRALLPWSTPSQVPQTSQEPRGEMIGWDSD